MLEYLSSNWEYGVSESNIAPHTFLSCFVNLVLVAAETLVLVHMYIEKKTVESALKKITKSPVFGKCFSEPPPDMLGSLYTGRFQCDVWSH